MYNLQLPELRHFVDLLQILQRRVPSNSRYKSVPARVDTGMKYTSVLCS